MAMVNQVPAPALGPTGPSQPQDIPARSNRQTSAIMSSSLSISTSSPVGRLRYAQAGYLTPKPGSVNQNGSFDFDRVIKSGIVHKRTRKTKAWKKVYLVLRPDLLSIYRNEQEVKLRQQINLADVTAVAYLKDPKRDHVFGLFTPSKNYHLEASSDKEALEWVELIRREAGIEEEEAEMRLASPEGSNGAYRGFGRQKTLPEEQLGSSFPEHGTGPGRVMTTRDGVRIPPAEPRMPSTLDYSGNEIGSHSDFSDNVGSNGYRDSSLSLSPSDFALVAEKKAAPDAPTARQAELVDLEQENERVIWHGYLYCLKSKGGVRQWKRLWAVLRPKKLAFYKSDEEYSAILLIPLSSIINAVEIDAISKSKASCMQIIAEDKSFRFCAPDDDALAKWLGALKSQLAKRKEAERRRD